MCEYVLNDIHNKNAYMNCMISLKMVIKMVKKKTYQTNFMKVVLFPLVYKWGYHSYQRMTYI